MALPVEVLQQTLEPLVGQLPMIVGVEPDSPADEAGFQEGDVIVTVDGQELATLQLDRSFETYRVELPAELTSNLDNDFAILRLDTETWRPNNSIPDATDIRDLGVRVDWIEVR